MASGYIKAVFTLAILKTTRKLNKYKSNKMSFWSLVNKGDASMVPEARLSSKVTHFAIDLQ